MKSQIASLAIMNCINDKKAPKVLIHPRGSTLTFNKEGLIKMLKAIVAHNNAAINPFDSLTNIELTEYEMWSDSVIPEITDDELEDMFPGRKTNPSRVYIPRCEHYKENPPGDDWDGSWALTKK